MRTATGPGSCSDSLQALLSPAPPGLQAHAAAFARANLSSGEQLELLKLRERYLPELSYQRLFWEPSWQHVVE